jgi:hypothetical protein
MSDTRTVMREFRFLDEKRKQGSLSPIEAQRWEELRVALGIPAPTVQEEAPQGYYADDGNWYPYAAEPAAGEENPSAWGQEAYADPQGAYAHDPAYAQHYAQPQDAGYAPQGYPQDPAYVQPYAYPQDPAYAQQQQGYAQDPAYAQQYAYPQDPSYAQQNQGYPQDPSYAQQHQGYPQDPAYAQQHQGYPQDPAYAQQHQGYADPQNGYPAEAELQGYAEAQQEGEYAPGAGGDNAQESTQPLVEGYAELDPAEPVAEADPGYADPNAEAPAPAEGYAELSPGEASATPQDEGYGDPTAEASTEAHDPGYTDPTSGEA